MLGDRSVKIRDYPKATSAAQPTLETTTTAAGGETAQHWSWKRLEPYVHGERVQQTHASLSQGWNQRPDGDVTTKSIAPAGAGRKAIGDVHDAARESRVEWSVQRSRMHAAVASVLGEAARRDTSVKTLKKVTTKSIAPAEAGWTDVGYD